MTFGPRPVFGKGGGLIVVPDDVVRCEARGGIVTPIGGSIALCHRVSGRTAAVPFGIHTTY